MSNPVTGVKGFIFSTLKADPALAALLTRPRPNTSMPVLNLYREFAPDTATYPLAIIRTLSGRDVWAMPATVRVQTDMAFAVEGYTDQPNEIVLDQIADRIDVALTGAAAELPAHGIRIHGFYRAAPLAVPEEREPERVYYRLGGEYRTVVSYL